LIRAGLVSVAGQLADKPGARVAVEADLALQARPRFVSRGGEKLDAALERFEIDATGLVAADVGASTGGFTDCLLQRGAGRVYAIDVGYGQLDWRLRNDERVAVMERTNARYVTGLPEPVNLVTVDVSFISLSLVMPVVVRWLEPAGQVVALIKPQFEAGRREVGKGGVVRDPEVHRAVLQNMLEMASGLRLGLCGLMASPLRGPAGNIEFLGWWQLAAKSLDAEEAIASCLSQERA
jgi:23S rRNA (cytidine1920-2'-O)/16S rRNA (cytidine1409-2'-O)-methyltransferase